MLAALLVVAAAPQRELLFGTTPELLPGLDQRGVLSDVLGQCVGSQAPKYTYTSSLFDLAGRAAELAEQIYECIMGTDEVQQFFAIVDGIMWWSENCLGNSNNSTNATEASSGNYPPAAPTNAVQDYAATLAGNVMSSDLVAVYAPACIAEITKSGGILEDLNVLGSAFTVNTQGGGNGTYTMSNQLSQSDLIDIAGSLKSTAVDALCSSGCTGILELAVSQKSLGCLDVNNTNLDPLFAAAANLLGVCSTPPPPPASSLISQLFSSFGR